eukprot:scaffold4839_cov136-Isochrysis_galbana.AAC.11
MHFMRGCRTAGSCHGASSTSRTCGKFRGGRGAPQLEVGRGGRAADARVAPQGAHLQAYSHGA